MQKLKKISKKDVKSDEKVKEVFFNYFSKIGLYYPKTGNGADELPPKSAAWKANFSIKWGKQQYRRDAWAMVRADLKKVFPADLYGILDKHYGPAGPAGNFVDGFTLEEKYHFCDLIIGSDRSTAEMQEVAKSALQYRTKK